MHSSQMTLGRTCLFMSLLIKVFCCSGLEELYALHCHLADLKRTVARYPALQILDVSFNQIDNVKTLVFLHFFFIFGSSYLSVVT